MSAQVANDKGLPSKQLSNCKYVPALEAKASLHVYFLNEAWFSKYTLCSKGGNEVEEGFIKPWKNSQPFSSYKRRKEKFESSATLSEYPENCNFF